MARKAMLVAAIATSMVASPMAPLVSPALADGNGIVGGIIGGIIAGAIINDANHRHRGSKTHRSSKSKTQKSAMSSAQREANREVQTSLNYFGYDVGTPDGSIGPRSRAAISQMQAFLGYPPTGEMSEYERTILTTAYHRGVAGGPVVMQAVGSSPWGVKGLLLAQRDEMAGVVAAPGTMAATQLQPPAPQVGVVQPGVTQVAVPQSAAPVTAKAATFVALAGTQNAEPAATLPALMPTDPATPSLPSFMGDAVAAGAQGSLASHCNKVSLLTNTNGGYATLATLQDANFVLSEQFCLARTYAMSAGEDMAQKVSGFTPQQITQQCAGFGPVLKDYVSALSMQPATEVISGAQGFILSSGMSPAQLTGTAKICLGVGYTTDDMDVAVGSALLLTALGEKAYAELLGHHLSQGYGAAIRPDLAMAWYDMALEALDRGAVVFAPGLEGRGALLRKAAYTAGGRDTDLKVTP